MRLDLYFCCDIEASPHVDRCGFVILEWNVRAAALDKCARLNGNIPSPSQGEVTATLPTLTAVKVMLYQGMREQGVGKAELARRLGWHLPQVDRVLDIQHKSRLDQIDAALGAIGQQLYVQAARRH